MTKRSAAATHLPTSTATPAPWIQAVDCLEHTSAPATATVDQLLHLAGHKVFRNKSTPQQWHVVPTVCSEALLHLEQACQKVSVADIRLSPPQEGNRLSEAVRLATAAC